MRRINSKNAFLLSMILGFSSISAEAQKQWSLNECINYALEHNIQIKKNKIGEQTALTNLKEAKAGLLPTVSASISQGLSYRPFQESQSSFVNGGLATSSTSKTTQNGSYGVNAAWTLWNGGKNRQNIKLQELTQEQSAYTTATAANNIQEQIVQLYIQILYSKEALNVNKELLKKDIAEYERGKEMKQQGQMSLSELTQLEAQVKSGEYDVVNQQTTIEEYKLQLKLLLELQGTEDFDTAELTMSDNAALANIPSKEEIYNAALESRPEIKNSKLAIQSSDINLKMAKAERMPTISLTAGIGDSHVTNSGRNYFDQMKQNLSGTIGVSVSVPITDGRKNKSAIERAKFNQLSSQLDLADTQKTLYSNIESYWLKAVSNQQKFVSAQTKVKSLQASFDLLDEQFKLGLKNIVELQTGRTNLLNAKQDLLQSKYTTLLNTSLLNFYAGKGVNM